MSALLAQKPAALVRRVGDEGGPLIREKPVAPAMAELERNGMVERTGQSRPEWPEDLALARLQGSSLHQLPGI